MKKLYKILTLLSVALSVSGASAFAQAISLSVPFSHTGATQTYTVPAGIVSMTILARGGGGGRNSDSAINTGNIGGVGGCAQATYTVTPGASLFINVGGRGTNGITSPTTAGGPGGFNGGGNGAFAGAIAGGGGGGASDVRLGGSSTSNAILVAGGGGGAGSLCGGTLPLESGGNGGTFHAGDGAAGCGSLTAPKAPARGGNNAVSPFFGTGGTCTSCGAPAGANGGSFLGGSGGPSSASGGGGGGYWGGGGGRYGGGGGGTNYFDPSATSIGNPPSGCAGGSPNHGYVTIDFTCDTRIKTVTANRTALCSGQTTLTVSDAVTGGTWTSSNTGLATVDVNTGVVTGTVTGLSGGIVGITYHLGPCEGILPITVNPLPGPILGDSTICSGLSSTLSNVTGGGTWTNAGVGTIDPALGTFTGTVPGPAAGTGTITYTLPTGCYRTANSKINPLPVAITGNPRVCVGLISTLSDATPGGTWYNTNTAPLTSVNSGTGDVTGVLAGVDTIVYKLTATGCIISSSFTVNPLPDPITGTQSVCKGFTTTLSNATPAGTWTSSNASIASVGLTTGIVTGVNTGALGAPGVATITYTLTATGCISTALVSVNPLPSIYPITPSTGRYCIGDVGVEVKASDTDPYHRYDLYSGATLVDTRYSTGSGGALSFGNRLQGTYTIIATDTAYSTRCTSLYTGTAVISEDTLPHAISGPTVLCGNATITLTDGGGGTWSSSNTNVTIGSSTGVVLGNPLSMGTSVITYTLPVSNCIITSTITLKPNYPIYGIAIGCVGVPLTLFDTTFVADGGAWSGLGVVDGGSTATVNSTGPVTTQEIKTITFTSGFGCVSTKTVTFNPRGLITGPDNVCVNNSIQLSNDNAGGFWSMTNGAATVINTPLPGLVTGVSAAIAAGIDTVVYTLASGCVSTYVITVNPLPAAITGPHTVCHGLNITLSDATIGGTWSTFTMGGLAYIDPLTGTVTAVAPGTDRVTYTITATGCIATYALTVNPLPDTIRGNLSICEGYGTSLFDLNTGGTWLSGDGAVASIGLTTGIAVAGIPGTSTITYTLPTGCIITATLTVNMSPPPITIVSPGRDTLCSGTFIRVANAMTGGTWSNKDPFVTTVIGPFVTGMTRTTWGIDSVIYTSAEGCKSRIPVYVAPIAPIIPGPPPINVCVGNTIQLTDIVTGGVWGTSNTTVATITSGGFVTGMIAPGTSVITYSIAYSATTRCTASTVVSVNVFPSPISGPGVVCSGSTITLSDASGTTTWSSSNGSVATVTNPGGVVTGVDPGGTATITFTLPTGCAVTKTVTVNPLGVIGGPSAFCYGDSITLTNSAAGGKWTSSLTTVAVIDSTTGKLKAVPPPPIVTTAVTVTYTTSLGCVATKTVSVDVVTPILGPARVCVGDTVILSDATGPGTWSSSDVTIVIPDASTGKIGGVSPGTAAITYTVAASGCRSFLFFRVNKNPDPIAGPGTVCMGATMTLSDNDGGGTWTSSNNARATISNLPPPGGLVTGIDSGFLFITYTLNTGCDTTRQIRVEENRAITGTLPLLRACLGNTSTLSNAVTGGTWTSDNVNIPITTPGGVVTNTAVGTATITYDNPNGCRALAVFTVNPLPDPITSTTTFVVCQGSTIQLGSTSTGGGWSTTATVISLTTPGGVVTGNAAGTGTVTYTLATGCYVTHVVTVTPSTPILTAPFRLCIGSTVRLSNATGGGTWSSSSTLTAVSINSSGDVTTNSVGTSVISYTTSAGCVSTVVFTVNDTPSIISGPHSVCSLSSVTLTSATTGGAWTAGPVGIGTITSPGGVFTGGTAGTGRITYTIASTGCRTTHTMTVLPLPAAITGTLVLCASAGSTTTISSGPAGGTWTSGTTTVVTIGPSTGDVILTGTQGTSVISYTLSTGCAVSRVFTVNAFPSATTGPTDVCVGSTITLSNPTTGGVWSTSATVASVTTPGGVVTGVVAGTATISYSLSGCVADYAVTVKPLPSGIITPLGDTNICPGSFIALTATTGSSLSYQWYDAAGPTLLPGETAASYIAAPSVNTSYQVRITSSITGCSILSRPMLVSVLPATASITSSVPSGVVCAGTVLVLTAAGISPTGYQWEMSGVPIPGANAVTFTPTASGTYDAIVSNGTGCSAKSNSIVITINPAPSTILSVLGPLSFCSGDNVVLEGAAGTGYTYQWYNGVTILSGETNRRYTATTAGTFRVEVTNTFGCTATSGSAITTVKALPAVLALTVDAPYTSPIVFCTGATPANIRAKITPAILVNVQWYQNGVAVPGATGDNFLVGATGRYKALITDPATGCSAFTPSDTATVILAPVILPLTSTSFCWGGSALLKANVLSGLVASYQWYLEGVPLAGATGQTYPATESGKYTVMITSACSITSLGLTVKENPLPNPLVTFDGAKFHVQSYYTSYQWYKNLTAVPGANFNYLSPSSNGNYKVAVIDTNGCQSFSDSYVLTGWTNPGGSHVGVGNVVTEDIRIYPNPAQNMVHVEAGYSVRAVIATIDGRVVIEQENAKDIDISQLANAVYTIMLYDANGQMVKVNKLVKSAE